MRQHRYILLPILILFLIGLVACVNVELIDNSARATSSKVKITFEWNGLNEKETPPPYLHLIAVRDVMTWRAHGYVATNNGDAPWFGISEPIIEEAPTPEPEPEPENPENPEEPEQGGEGTEGENNQPSGRAEGEEGTGEEETEPGTGEGEGETEPEPTPDGDKIPFRLRGGEYNILAVNADLETETVELKCLKDGKEMVKPEGGNYTEEESLKEYLNDINRKVNELYLCLKSSESPNKVKDKDLPDFNPQYEYVDGVKRIFYTLQTGFNVVPGIDAHLHLDMQPISQEIQVEFTVELQGNIDIPDTEFPVIELSGICGRFNLMEAYVDTTTLYRSVEYAEKDTGQSTGNLRVYRASFHTLGVVPSYDPNYLNGPGIIQVAVKAVSTNPDSKDKDGRYVYAGINPYTELNESKIIEEGADGKLRLRFSREPIIIKVEKHLVIDENLLVAPSNGLGWEQQDPTDVDIDI